MHGLIYIVAGQRRNMIKFNCYFCQKELVEPGALLFAPPEKIDNGGETFYTPLVHKYNVCGECFDKIILMPTWIDK